MIDLKFSLQKVCHLQLDVQFDFRVWISFSPLAFIIQIVVRAVVLFDCQRLICSSLCCDKRPIGSVVDLLFILKFHGCIMLHTYVFFVEYSYPYLDFGFEF